MTLIPVFPALIGIVLSIGAWALVASHRKQPWTRAALGRWLRITVAIALIAYVYVGLGTPPIAAVIGAWCTWLVVSSLDDRPVAPWTDAIASEYSRLDRIAERYRARYWSVDPVDRRGAEAAVAAICDAVRQPRLPCVWVRSPREAAIARSVIDGFLAFGVVPATARDRRMAVATRPRGQPEDVWAAMVDRLAEGSALPERRGATAPTTTVPDASRRARKAAADLRWRLRPATESLHEAVRRTLEAEGLDRTGPTTAWIDELVDLALTEFLVASVAAYRVPPVTKSTIDLFQATGGWWWTDLAVILCERPAVIRTDSQGLLHSVGQPAIAYRDGWSIWAIRGEPLPRSVVESPTSASVEALQAIRSTIARAHLVAAYGRDRYRESLVRSSALIAGEPDRASARAALAAFGEERYVRERGVLAHQDLDVQGQPRRVWRASRKDDAPLVMLEVVNSTPEPDGSFHHYLLRVPPDTTTCRDAVAWTFGLRPEQYAPAVES